MDAKPRNLADNCRTAEDTAMNRELREVERWNDPAASFLTAVSVSASSSTSASQPDQADKDRRRRKHQKVADADRCTLARHSQIDSVSCQVSDGMESVCASSPYPPTLWAEADHTDRTAKDPDRKLSFEARFFQAQNARGRKELADQAFSMEDM
jgi:pre-mRNA-splicing factor CWC26